MLRYHGWPLLVAGGVLPLGSELQGQQPAPTKEKPVRTDVTGEPLPEFALSRFRPERMRPGDQVVAVAISTDRKLLATSSQDRVIRIWELASGKLLHQLTGHHGVAWRLLFQVDGKTLISSSDDSSIRIWNLEQGRLVTMLLGHQGAIWFISLTPDGKTLASASEDGTIRFWDLASAKEVKQFLGHHGGVWPISFGPDGRLLASGGSDGSIRLWDAGVGREIRQTPAHQGGVWPLAFSSDGKTIVSAGWQDRTIRLWEVATGKERAQFKPAGGLKFIAFSPDCRTVACGGEDQTIRLWDAATGKERRRLEGHSGQILTLAFSSDGSLLASGSADNTVLLWDMAAVLKDDPLSAVELNTKEIEVLWADLASADTARAHQVIWTLIAGGKSAIPFLESQLKPATASTDHQRIEKLIDQLDDDVFLIREKAMLELEKIGSAGEVPLRRALDASTSLEVRRRIERILERLEGGSMPPESLRAWRALEVLERIASDDTRKVLEKLARGAPDASLTRDAKLGLNRLTRRTSGP